MLTATPINNRLSDFRHMTELFTRRDEAYFARTIGVNQPPGALQPDGASSARAHRGRMSQTARST